MDEIYCRIEKIVAKMRREALEMGYRAGNKGAHFGAGLSSMEIMACLYHGIMNIDPKNPEKKERDYLILGKAHCVLSYYTSLAYAGYFSIDELKSFDMDASEFMGHPIMNPKKGIEFSGGSLGMALSQGVGLALSKKKKKEKNLIFVLLGDGECQEGANWEAAMSAAHYQLDNLIVIVDRNRLQYDGETKEVMSLKHLGSKFESFGFQVFHTDGHHVEKLYQTLEYAKNSKEKRPSIVIAETIKGKGISFMENKKEWHHKELSKELYQKAVQELGGSKVGL